MKTFIAVYRGATIGEAKVIAVTTDQLLVRDVVARLLSRSTDGQIDAVIDELEGGRQAALRRIDRECRSSRVH